MVVVDIAGGELARPVRATGPWPSTAPSSRRCSGRSMRPDAPCCPARRFRPACRKRPSPSDAGRCSRGRVCNGDDVAHGVVAHVAHVNAPGRIGEHLKDIVLVPRIVVLGQGRRSLRSILPASGARHRGGCNVRWPFRRISENHGVGRDLHHETNQASSLAGAASALSCKAKPILRHRLLGKGRLPHYCKVVE